MYIRKLNKDKARRVLTNFFEVRLKVLNVLFKLLSFYEKDFNVFFFILLKYSEFKRNVFFSRVNNLCVLTGRQSGTYKFFKVSRIELRDSKNIFYGLRKSSW